jgi:hypothetical protein
MKRFWILDSGFWIGAQESLKASFPGFRTAGGVNPESKIQN